MTFGIPRLMFNFGKRVVEHFRAETVGGASSEVMCVLSLRDIVPGHALRGERAQPRVTAASYLTKGIRRRPPFKKCIKTTVKVFKATSLSRESVSNTIACSIFFLNRRDQ